MVILHYVENEIINVTESYTKLSMNVINDICVHWLWISEVNTSILTTNILYSVNQLKMFDKLAIVFII